MRLKSFWPRYAVAISLILGLLFTSHMFSRAELRHGVHDAAAINMSGRQRMLLEQIAHLSHDYAQAPSKEMRARLEESALLFEQSHYELVKLSQEDPFLHDLYSTGANSIHALVLRLIGDVNWILVDTRGTEFALRDIERMADGELSAQLREAANAFEAMASRRSLRLTTVQDYSLYAAILTIIGEMLLIFWPADKTIRRNFQQLEQEHGVTQAALQRLANFATLASDLFWETDMQGRVVYAEGAALDYFQGGRETIVGCDYLDIIQMDDKNLSIIANAISTLSAYQGVRGVFTDASGRNYNMLLSGKPRFNDQGKLAGYLGTADDISNYMQEHEEVRKLAYTDPLTGLSNQRAYQETIPNLVRKATPRAPLYLLALDLDGFKAVNDTYGHGAGDEVLKAVSSRIRSVIRDGDMAVRAGGDEFFIICNAMPSYLAIMGLADRLNERLSEPYSLSNGKTVRVSASIGVACAPHDATEHVELCETADKALYAAKRSGRNQTCFARDMKRDELKVS